MGCQAFCMALLSLHRYTNAERLRSSPSRRHFCVALSHVHVFWIKYWMLDRLFVPYTAQPHGCLSFSQRTCTFSVEFCFTDDSVDDAVFTESDFCASAICFWGWKRNFQINLIFFWIFFAKFTNEIILRRKICWTHERFE